MALSHSSLAWSSDQLYHFFPFFLNLVKKAKHQFADNRQLEIRKKNIWPNLAWFHLGRGPLLCYPCSLQHWPGLTQRQNTTKPKGLPNVIAITSMKIERPSPWLKWQWSEFVFFLSLLLHACSSKHTHVSPPWWVCSTLLRCLCKTYTQNGMQSISCNCRSVAISPREQSLCNPYTLDSQKHTQAKVIDIQRKLTSDFKLQTSNHIMFFALSCVVVTAHGSWPFWLPSIAGETLTLDCMPKTWAQTTWYCHCYCCNPAGCKQRYCYTAVGCRLELKTNPFLTWKDSV